MLGFNRPPPKTRLGRCLRRSERTLAVLLVLYASLHVFPQVLFAHSVTVDGITIYSRTPLPAEAGACAARAAGLVRQSELAVRGRREKIFVCNSKWMFRLFDPAADGFAFSVPITNHVFIASADFASDVSQRYAPDYNKRTLSSVIAHEITHGLIRNRLGWLRGVRLAEWVNEGYCDFVAQEGSFPEAEGLRLVEAGQEHPSPSFQYFKFRQMVRHLVETKHLSFSQIVDRSSEFAVVEEEVRTAFQKELR